MSYPLLDVFLTMLWFFLWTLWIFLVVWIIMDIFRSHDLSGWGKAGWLVFVILLPFVGVLTYLIARGGGMSDRYARRLEAKDEAIAAHAGQASPNGAAEEVTKLADLRDRGIISDTEFEHGKAKALG